LRKKFGEIRGQPRGLEKRKKTNLGQNLGAFKLSAPWYMHREGVTPIQILGGDKKDLWRPKDESIKNRCRTRWGKTRGKEPPVVKSKSWQENDATVSRPGKRAPGQSKKKRGGGRGVRDSLDLTRCHCRVQGRGKNNKANQLGRQTHGTEKIKSF